MPKANGHDLPFLVTGGGIGGLVTALPGAARPEGRTAYDGMQWLYGAS